MPIVRVEMIEGRTEDQKQRLAEIITDAMVKVAGSKSEDTYVLFEDVPKENWAVGGRLVIRAA